MKTPGFRIRPAVATDVPALAELGPTTFVEAFGAVFPAPAISERMAMIYAPARLGLDLADPAQAWFLAEAEQLAVGFLALHQGPPPVPMAAVRPLEFARVYVRAGWHGRGPGYALMEAGLAEAQRRASDLLWLTAWERNPKALAFYRAHGFRKAGEVPVRFASLELPHLVMTRPFPP